MVRTEYILFALTAVLTTVVCIGGAFALEPSDPDDPGISAQDIQCSAVSTVPSASCDVGSAADKNISGLTDLVSADVRAAVPNYFVRFDPNGGTLCGNGGAVVTFGAEFCYDQYAVRPGYRFEGWYTMVCGRSTCVTSGDVWNFTDVFYLFAKWVPNEYTVTFDPCGGILNGEMNAVATFDAEFCYDQYAKLDFCKFAGWCTERNGDGMFIFSGKPWIIPEDVCLYAVWKDDCFDFPRLSTVELTFDTNGGTLVRGAETVTKILNYPFKITQRATRPGYDFLGWFTENETVKIEVDVYYYRPTVINPNDHDNDGYLWWHLFMKEYTLHAKWAPCTSTVTFDPNGGTLDGEKTLTASYDSAFDFTQTAYRQGYVLGGWYTKPFGNGYSVTSGEIWHYTSSAKTLYAYWIPESAVTFAVRGETSGGLPADSGTDGRGAVLTETCGICRLYGLGKISGYPDR